MENQQSASPLVFEPFDPAFIINPHPTLRRFREEQPIFYWPQARAYMFFRYRDMMALLRDPRLSSDPTLGAGFPAEMRARFPDYVALREQDLFVVSTEAHERIRKLINPLFGPRAVEAHRERITDTVRDVLSGLPEEGVINFYRDFAQAYPVRVIASLLNIPRGNEAEFLAMADALIATLMPGMPEAQFASYMPAISRGLAVVRDCIRERRERPIPGDLLSLLIHACDDEERLSDGELVSLVSGLLIGGSDTTVHLTTYSMLELLRHPAQLELVRQDSGLLRSAFDETLRYNSFGRSGGLARFAASSFTYEGVQLERGQVLFFNMMSAFRDPEFVSDPDVFDIRRRTHSSPWFGLGPHFCVGASLARLEADIAMQRFLSRYPSIELADEPVYGHHPVFRDIEDLPLRVSTRLPGPAAS